MMENSGCAPRKPDRKTVEKNRRIYMKSLYSRLDTLLPGSTKDGLAPSIPDRIIEAADYIAEMRERVERLRARKRQLVALNSTGSTVTNVLPHMEVKELSGGLKAVKMNTTSEDNQFAFYNAVRLLEEEGVEVLNAHLPAVGSEVPKKAHEDLKTGLLYSVARLDSHADKVVTVALRFTPNLLCKSPWLDSRSTALT